MLERVVIASSRGRWITIVAMLLLGALSARHAVEHLGINTDTAEMMAPDLPWRRANQAFSAAFPQLDDRLIVVVDATTIELAERAARELATRLAARTDRVLRVAPGVHSTFFARNAFLYLEHDALLELSDDLIAAQPLIGRLSHAPRLATVTELLGEALERPDEIAAPTLDAFAAGLADASTAAIDGVFHRMSWRSLLSAELHDSNERFAHRAVLAMQPRLDYSQLFPAADTMALIREIATEAEMTPANGLRVRITGSLAMSDEELRAVSKGAARSGVLALIAVSLVLVVGLGSARIALAAVLTLLTGLAITAAFAAVSVGDLNMVSVAFAVLYIGLGADYAVHFGLAYRDRRRRGMAHEQAIGDTTRALGGALAMCALTTAFAFYAFMTTDFDGLAELGLIAGSGMFVSFVTTLVLMPALLAVLGIGSRTIRSERGPLEGRAREAASPGAARAVSILSVALLAVCLLIAVNVRFDGNPLNLRPADGEALETFRELIRDGERWRADALIDAGSDVSRLERTLAALPEVASVRTVNDLVPARQVEKLIVVDELALLLGPELASTASGELPRAGAASVSALTQLARRIESRVDASPELRRLGVALDALADRCATIDDTACITLLRAFERNVLDTFGDTVTRLASALDASEFDRNALPRALRDEWVNTDGVLRMSIEASENLNDPDALERFVTAVTRHVPDAVGAPVVYLAAAAVAVGAFKQALMLALAGVALILWLSLRSARSVVIVIYPLLLGAAVTVATMVLLDMPFNFANVIALPLLLGISVDSGIHMLKRSVARSPAGSHSSTPRAVLTSAMTSLAGFGNLAFSSHPGTASMGWLLTVGMLAMLVATLLVLPALARSLQVRAL